MASNANPTGRNTSSAGFAKKSGKFASVFVRIKTFELALDKDFGILETKRCASSYSTFVQSSLFFLPFLGWHGVSFLSLVLDQDHPPAVGARASEFNGDQAVHGSLEGKAGRIQWSNINDHGKKPPPKLVGCFFLEGG